MTLGIVEQAPGCDGGTKDMFIKEKEGQCSLLMISPKGSVLCGNRMQHMVMLEWDWWGM